LALLQGWADGKKHFELRIEKTPSAKRRAEKKTGLFICGLRKMVVS